MYFLDELLALKIRDIEKLDKEQIQESVEFWTNRLNKIQENESNNCLRIQRQNLLDTLAELGRIVTFMETKKAA